MFMCITSDKFFNTTSSQLTELLTGIAKQKDGEVWTPPTRRLREGPERALQAQDGGAESQTRFECDDTLFECQPVCVATLGVTRSKVAPEMCRGVKPDDCSCRCFYSAYWTCEDGRVVCKATISDGAEQTVGDLVCATRGTPKPAWNPKTLQRAVGECEPLPVLRERRPAEKCMPQYVQSYSPNGPLMLDVDLDLMATAAVHTVVAAVLVLFAL